MINKMCKTGGFKLPHMSPLKVKKVAKEKLPEFDRTPKRLDIQEPIPVKMEAPINFGHNRVNPFAPEEKVPSFDETFKSSSGDNPEEFKAKYRDSVASTIEDKRLANFIKNMEVLDNPEYASYTKKLNPDTKVFNEYDEGSIYGSGPESEPARSEEYDFFVKHRTPESDKLAYNMMDLNDEMNEARKNKDFDKVRELSDKSKNMRSVIKNAGRVMEEGGKSEYLEDKMRLRGEL